MSYENISSLDERRRVALEEVDSATFSWFHVKTCLVAGAGFFTDAYDIFAINIAAYMIGFVYGQDGTLSTGQDLGIKVATPVGTLVGQLLFGWLADIVGRKKMYGIELVIIIVGTFVQALAGDGPSLSVFGVLIIWRFITGIGIGGDYPLSAVITSEFASIRIRGRMMTAVFASQGWGNLTAALVSFIVVSAYKTQILSGPDTKSPPVDSCWRLLIGFGCVPGAIALYFRLTIPETPRFTMDIERNVAQAAQDVDTFLTDGTFGKDPNAVVTRADVPQASWWDFVNYFGNWKNGKVLLGTSWSWFALDVAYYGLGLNTSVVLDAIRFGESDDVNGIQADNMYKTLHNVSVGNLILSAGGLIPGYYATFFLIDRWGRKPIQLMGFIMLTIIFVCMGFGYDAMIAHNASGPKGAFVFLFCLANFFQNFGPNTTTFIIPGEIFPTRYRSTGHGISAASGKLGAIIAQVGFSYLKDVGGMPGKGAFLDHILQIFSLFMLTGVFSTLLIPETKGLSLEKLSNENQENFVKNANIPLLSPLPPQQGSEFSLHNLSQPPRHGF